jgi:endonuclease/exonuclease/phosphatase family metal-dependent hydrolase
MRRLHGLRDLPWLCSGDFNETLHATELFSEHERDEWQMRAFREAVEDCALQDLGFSGLPFTWDNRQDGRENVKARIDRALGNAALLNQFQVVKVRHFSIVQSDHYMVV